ncbi:protein NRT1/ PTR FAMILY 6.3-like [Nymphaea colorata]|nr:protein NRT1/ PTR FAMILY 6.3-like [Nymphaea colorata]
MAPSEHDDDGSNRVVSDAWDYRGNPATTERTGGWFSAASILGVELTERLTTLGIAVNLVTYLTGVMHLGSARSANMVTNFLGTSFLLCLFGGFIADTYLGRYLTIAIFTTVQATGVTVLTVSTMVPGLRPPHCTTVDSCIKANGTQLSVLYLALYLTALGTGGLKSSVSGLGSDQFDESSPREKSKMISFFSWFFFLINIGSLAAVTVLVYIQDNLGRKWGYGICACAILVALILFLSGTRKYRFKKLAGSPITRVARVISTAWRNRHRDLPSDPTLLYQGDMTCVNGDAYKRTITTVAHTKRFRFLDKAAIIVDDHGMDPEKKSERNIISLAQVEEVKLVLSMMPIWATTIIFWTAYAQMTTFSVQQATTMDRRLVGSFQIPAASLTVFFVGSVLVVVPIYDRAVVPIARRFTGRREGITTLQRIGVGLVLSILAMVASALTEIKRLSVAHATPSPSGTVPLSVFWLVPQFFLVGAGEAFTYIGQLDFFLRECPAAMKTMSTGMFLSTLSLGFFFSSALVAIVHMVTSGHGTSGWITDNLNKGKLYNFYWLLAALSVLNFAVYLYCAKWYVYKEQRISTTNLEEEEKVIELEACCQA